MNNINTQTYNNQPVCTCPHCNSACLSRSGFDRGTQRYRCKNCRKTFKATAGTPAHGLHKKEKIARYLQALQNGMSVRKAAKYVGISSNTSFAWRHKFLSSLKTQTVVQTTGKISSAEIIKLEYSAKGRRKAPEKHTSPTKTVALFRDGQLELHKLAPLRQTRQVAQIFSESTANIYAMASNKILTAGIKHAENRIKVKNRHVSQPIIAKVTQQVAKLLNWMERFKGVASKYLQNYWNWYTSLLNLAGLKQESEYFCRLCINNRSLVQYYTTKDI